MKSRLHSYVRIVLDCIYIPALISSSFSYGNAKNRRRSFKIEILNNSIFHISLRV